MEGLIDCVTDDAQAALGDDFVRVGSGSSREMRQPGSYALLIRLNEPQLVRFGKKQGHLAAGWYAYCGSAKGPGGVGARIARHLSATKKPHWHVDRLTLAASKIEALAAADACECEIAACLNASGSFEHILPGFGSSDCRSCSSHLLAWRG
ncbi:MAG: GIY-YIG nuclease family protein [Novosphingobium sp.]|nr:GIY-YIG nuclease family protein [Novosphingobium sp.]